MVEPENIQNEERPRVLLVDDQSAILNGLAMFLQGSGEFEVCGTAGTADEAMQAIAATHPDVLILDMNLGTSDGVEVARDVRQQHPKLAILMLSMHGETTFAQPAIEAGANGYIMKSDASEDLTDAIHTVLRGDIYLSPVMKKKIGPVQSD